MTALETEFTQDEINQVRTDTPGLSSRIHLDNCGSSLVPRAVVEALQAHLELETRVGGYVAQEQQSEQLAAVYRSLARLLGGQPTDYAFVGSAVDGWSKAFYSIPLGPSDNIVTAYNEYCSNFVSYLQRAKRDGVEIRVARPTAEGTLDLDHLASLIDANTKLISLAHIPSSNGQAAPVYEIGKIAKSRNILFLLDACQSTGQRPVNFEEIGCDMATGTGRKFLRGPRGTGYVYINEKARSVVDPVVLTNQAAAWTEDNAYELRSDAGIFEAWERSCMNQLGFGAALDYLLDLGVKKSTDRLSILSGHLREGLAAMAQVTPTCPVGADGAIITFNKAGWQAEDIKAEMAKHDIGVQVSRIVHERLDMGARGLETAVRISPHYYNTIEELDRFLNVLEGV